MTLMISSSAPGFLGADFFLFFASVYVGGLINQGLIALFAGWLWKSARKAGAFRRGEVASDLTNRRGELEAAVGEISMCFSGIIM